MLHFTFRRLALLLIITVITLSIISTMDITNASNNSSTDTTVPTNDAIGNPLTAKWEGPFGGVPPFDKVQIALFKPALEAAMTEQLAEVDKIANDSAAPTFDNTIVALERIGQSFNRVGTLYGVWGATMNGPEFQVVQREMAPKLAQFGDRITQNEALFKRIETVYNSPEKAKLNSEQQRLAWVYHTNFVRSGARLSPEAKSRLSQINQELAGLFTKFSQNVLVEESEQFVAIKSEDE